MAIAWSLSLVAFYSLTSADWSIQTLLETQTKTVKGADREELPFQKVIFPKCQSICSRRSRNRETSLVMNHVQHNKVVMFSYKISMKYRLSELRVSVHMVKRTHSLDRLLGFESCVFRIWMCGLGKLLDFSMTGVLICTLGCAQYLCYSNCWNLNEIMYLKY